MYLQLRQFLSLIHCQCGFLEVGGCNNWHSHRSINQCFYICSQQGNIRPPTPQTPYPSGKKIIKKCSHRSSLQVWLLEIWGQCCFLMLGIVIMIYSYQCDFLWAVSLSGVVIYLLMNTASVIFWSFGGCGKLLTANVASFFFSFFFGGGGGGGL